MFLIQKNVTCYFHRKIPMTGISTRIKTKFLILPMICWLVEHLKCSQLESI